MLRGSFVWRWLPWAIRGDIENDDKQYSGATTFRKIESSQCVVALHLFHFGQFFPILTIPAPTKVVVTSIYSARAAAAKLEIMDGFTFDDISTFFASDCIPNNSRHNHSFFNAVPIFSTTIRTETMQQDGAFLQNGVLLHE